MHANELFGVRNWRDNIGNFISRLYNEEGYTQWCRSKPIARGALLIARGALFLHASL